MDIQHRSHHRPAQFLAGAALAGILLFTTQAYATESRGREAPRGPSLAQNHHRNDIDRPNEREQEQHREQYREHEGAGPRDRGEHGPRGRPPTIRPPIHPHPPHPVVVVPPCKRGGPGITPC